MFINLSESTEKYKKDAARILFEASKSVASTCWKTIESAEDEISECCQEDKIAIGLIEENELIGWVGLKPMYGIVT